jgi:opacity protein-like surface antigen
MEDSVRRRFQVTAIGISLLLVVFGVAPAIAENDVALSIYGAFSGATNGNGVQESPSNAAGGLFELRHISNPLLGWEATYSFNRANQVYSTACGANVTCAPTTPAAVSADAHEITGDWVPSIHISNLRPFALLGIGALFNEPAGSQSSTTSSNKPVFVYGAGLDWGLIPHIGVRFQYRGNLYKAPDVTELYTSTNAFTRTAEPVLGVYFKF